MQLSKGDKVKFLNEKGGGVVAKIIDSKTVLVIDSDGFEVPFLSADLVKIEPEQPRGFVKPAVIKEEPIQEKPQREIKKISKTLVNKPVFAIVPKNELSSSALTFDLYLLNDGTFGFYYVATFEKAGKQRVIDKGELEPDTSLLLTSLSKTRLQEYAAINIQLIVFDDSDFLIQKPISFSYSIDGMNIAKSILYSENEYFDEKALVIPVRADLKPEDFFQKPVDFDKVIAEKEKSNILKKSPENTEKSNDLEEIDLHIEEIVDDHKDMEPGEIIKIQLARFTTALETAIKAKTKRIVFIHGVGNGKLKLEIRKTLDQKYSEHKYQDASFAEYGFGATMVIIKS